MLHILLAWIVLSFLAAIPIGKLMKRVSHDYDCSPHDKRGV